MTAQLTDGWVSCTPQQAVEYTGMGIDTIRALLDSGELPFFFKPPGRRYKMIRRVDLDATLAKLVERAST